MEKLLTNIQILRAFAALNVVYFHILANAEKYNNPVIFLNFLNGWGSNGVDLFFVISGFVMVFRQKTKQKSILIFFKDRIIRIIPNYWFLCLSISLCLYLFPNGFNTMTFSTSWLLGSMLFVSQIFVKKEPIIFVGWTLEYEMLFYLIFGISLATKSITKSVLATTITIIILIISFELDVIMIEFIYGMIIGLVFTISKIRKKMGLFFLVFGVISLISTLYFKTNEINRIVTCGIPSALIILGAISIPQVKIGLLSKIGDASFSIYLIQAFTIPFFYKLNSRINNDFLNSDITSLLCMIITVLAGLLLYKNYETWVIQRIKRI